MRTLVLASTSPRRRELLIEHGYEIELVPPKIAEVMPEFLTVFETALFNACRKAATVSNIYPEKLVLAADTLVSIDGETLGKPADMMEATLMLSRLSGREHLVLTGVWLMRGNPRQSLGFVEKSRVRFRKVTREEIRQYFEQIDPLDKAGAYAAQTDPIGLIEEIIGSRTNVVGLPMEALEKALKTFEGL
ncbi:MAG: Maf family protein [Verrucomicrobiota bacterium]|nr:Maf family protein [Verrucomicrobiota bacterium]